MAGVVRSVTERVVVEAGVFGLQDVDAGATPVPWPAELPDPGFAVFARRNRLDVECSVRDVDTAVTLEAWDGAPPPETGDGVDVEELELALSSGTVQLWELTGGGSATTFAVGGPGRYVVRCATTGQSDAAVLEATGEEIPDDTVAYTLSFWPAG